MLMGKIMGRSKGVVDFFLCLLFCFYNMMLFFLLCEIYFFNFYIKDIR